MKNNQNKGKRTVSSVESYQAEDIFSFLGKNQQELNSYLSKDRLLDGKNLNSDCKQQFIS